MPWQRQFEPEEALSAVIELFWSKGFAATSIQDIVQYTGVNRASLYSTFGDKRALYLAALKRYDRVQRVQWFEGLVREHGGLGAIREAFAQAAELPPDGCFLVNTTLEVAPHDPEVVAVVDAAYAETQALFEAQLREAGVTDPSGRASGLLSMFLGLRVLSRTGVAPSIVQGILRQVEDLTR